MWTRGRDSPTTHSPTHSPPHSPLTHSPTHPPLTHPLSFFKGAIASSPSVTNALCCGYNGTVTTSASGGTSPYTYTWAPQILHTFSQARLLVFLSVLVITVITLLIPMAVCFLEQLSQTPPSTSPSLPLPSLSSPLSLSLPLSSLSHHFVSGPLSATVSYTNATCYGFNGTATVTATGGTGSYTARWTNTQTEVVSSYTTLNIALYTGSYSVVVTDSNGCQYSLCCLSPNLQVLPHPLHLFITHFLFSSSTFNSNCRNNKGFLQHKWNCYNNSSRYEMKRKQVILRWHGSFHKSPGPNQAIFGI
jgi:SprB repeat